MHNRQKSVKKMNIHRILVVDDEPKLVRLVREVLNVAGYAVLTTGNGAEAVELVAMDQPDLMILDILLQYGEFDGYEVARRVRQFSDIPIIMLTAKVRESDLLRGFEAGADDYMTKPFSSKELLARIRALLMRVEQRPGQLAQGLIVCGELEINPASRRVKLSGNLVQLTATEYNLLYELASHPNQVMLHEQLLTAVWGSEYRDDIDYLRAYIRYLRKKLEAVPSEPKMIVTVPGVGYMISVEEE
jgi:two-component system KDP operon response regulator KdpE